MTAPPTHPCTGEPEPRLTAASEELLDALGSRDARIYGEPLRVQLREIEAEAAKRERDRISEAIAAAWEKWGRGVPPHMADSTDAAIGGAYAHCLSLVDPLGASPDPVSDEPPGVATEMHGK